MPRPKRMDFMGAIHRVSMHGQEGSRIFFEPSILARPSELARRSAVDVQQLERTLNETCAEYDVAVHAYSVAPNAAVLVLQSSGAPLEAFMHRLCGQYARYLHAAGKVAPGCRAFRGRYDSQVIAPEYLPHAVRRVHRAPYLAESLRQGAGYPFSSESAYLGGCTHVRLKMQATKSVLEQKGFRGVLGYRQFMAQNDSAYVARLFDRGSRLDSRIVGGNLYVAHARDLAAHPAPRPTAEQIIAAVAELLRVEPSQLNSATHAGVLGRSLVAWYAVRAGSATLAGAGKWFSVTGATLGQGVSHYRRIRPDLFEKNPLREL
jgi:hypothetical protein